MTEPAAPQAVPAPPQPVPEAAARGPQPTTDTGVPASTFGLLPDGAGFVAKLGPGLRLGADFLSGQEVPLEQVPQPLPGIRFTTAQWRNRQMSLRGMLAIPHVASGDFTVRVNSQGTASIHGRATRSVALPALGNPELTLALSEEGAFTGTVRVEGADLLPRALRRRATATGSATLTLVNGRLSGDGTVELAYRELGNGTVNFRFSEQGQFAADGSIRVTPPLVDELRAELAVDEAGNLNASATVQAGALRTSVPGLTVVGGTVAVGYQNGQPSGSLTGFSARYAGLGGIVVDNATVDRSGSFAGAGTFSFEIPGLDVATGRVQLRDGRLSGQATLSAEAFPAGLPVRRPTITARFTDGNLGVSGSAIVDLGPAGTGNFQASWSEEGVFAFGGEVQLTVPGLDAARVRVDYADGAIQGEAQIAVSSELLPGLDGSVTVRYAQDRWSGETTLNYSADDGKLSGTITVTVAQTEQNTLELGGSGAVTAQIAPRLQGTLTATILPEGAIDVSGAIEVTEPLELFPEQRLDRELFRHSQNIPLWAILVAVIRVRAGVRAGVGPGVFRNIRVEGSYTIGAAEADPTFSITGELYIPAFVEGYVAFGAGLGLDVVLGSLTGGIEAVGTAGLYGAISVVPELTYQDGDWGIEGTATLAAGARLKLGLNAWAEIEALWVTVWDRQWKLADHVMPIGPDLALQAKMNYKFGSPTPPELEINSSDIDSDSLIRGAMPEDGPAESGAREALQNRAEWQGALREQRQAPVPPEVAAEAQPSETPPQPAQRRPPHGSGPPAAGPQSAAGQAGAAQPGPGVPGHTPPSEPAQSAAVDAAARPDSLPDTVPSSQVPNADQPRYPQPVTLATLEEPPALLPRTAQQERDDVAAARQVVELASRESTDSDRLDDYFPRIKNRFRLSQLGYEGDFHRGFRVVGKINPEFSFEPDEVLSGTGIPGDLQQGRITEVGFRTQNLHGSTVGIEMEASPLGPDHPEGTGPSGQEELMIQLPTNPQTYRDADARYIRGHLLNDNLGGPGQAMNMFPITAQANSRHHSTIESNVKNWVNDRRLWVKYAVRIQNIGPLRPAGGGKGSIDADLVAEASVLSTRLTPVAGLTRRVTIASKYQVGDIETASVVQAEDETRLGQTQARAIDLAADVQLSSRHETTSHHLTPKMYADLEAARATYGVAGTIDRLTGPGFQEGYARVLTKAWGQARAAGSATVELNLDQGERGVFTRISNMWDALRTRL